MMKGCTQLLLQSCRAVTEVHAGEEKEGAEEKPGGDGFAEQPPGEKDGGDGIEIDPVGGNDGA